MEIGATLEINLFDVLLLWCTTPSHGLFRAGANLVGQKNLRVGVGGNSSIGGNFKMWNVAILLCAHCLLPNGHGTKKDVEDSIYNA